MKHFVRIACAAISIIAALVGLLFMALSLRILFSGDLSLAENPASAAVQCAFRAIVLFLFVVYAVFMSVIHIRGKAMSWTFLLPLLPFAIAGGLLGFGHYDALVGPIFFGVMFVFVAITLLACILKKEA